MDVGRWGLLSGHPEARDDSVSGIFQRVKMRGFSVIGIAGAKAHLQVCPAVGSTCKEWECFVCVCAVCHVHLCASLCLCLSVCLCSCIINSHMQTITNSAPARSFPPSLFEFSLSLCSPTLSLPPPLSALPCWAGLGSLCSPWWRCVVGVVVCEG